MDAALFRLTMEIAAVFPVISSHFRPQLIVHERLELMSMEGVPTWGMLLHQNNAMMIGNCLQ